MIYMDLDMQELKVNHQIGGTHILLTDVSTLQYVYNFCLSNNFWLFFLLVFEKLSPFSRIQYRRLCLDCAWYFLQELTVLEISMLADLGFLSLLR
ncbi:hypothetical protein CW304_22015 [Bacillus sp. UFRGS-B20]|nr:hypothetical protein CW304_22015 [Bacillus sp. UFRGS-B20]